MSKKNNKGKLKAYAEYLKERERKQELDKIKRQEKKDTNRLTNILTDQIEDITLNLEKEEKMDVEPRQSKVADKKRKHKKIKQNK